MNGMQGIASGIRPDSLHSLLIPFIALSRFPCSPDHGTIAITSSGVSPRSRRARIESGA